MNNTGVICDVCECCHNVDNCKCNLSSIKVTHQYAGADMVETPHFCKNFEAK